MERHYLFFFSQIEIFDIKTEFFDSKIVFLQSEKYYDTRNVEIYTCHFFLNQKQINLFYFNMWIYLFYFLLEIFIN